MKPYLSLKKLTSPFFATMFILLAVSPLVSQNTKQSPFKTKRQITYLDGTPAKGLKPEYFDVVLTAGSVRYMGVITGVSKDTLFFRHFMPASYKLLYMGAEIVNFTISEKNGQYICDLPDRLHLPFNYLIKTDSVRTIDIFDETGKKINQVTTNKNGYATLTIPQKVIDKRFFVCYFNDQFPQIKIYREQRTKYRKEIRYRQINFKPEHRSLDATTLNNFMDNMVHNLDKDIYYRLQKLSFQKQNGEEIYHWLLVYDRQQQKAAVHKLDISGYLKLYLDEKGKPVVSRTFKDDKSGNEIKENYFVGDIGTLQKSKDIYINPYRFDGNFVSGTTWEVPVFLGIPLTQGNHTVTINCEGKNGKILTSTKLLKVAFSPQHNKLLYQNPDGSFTGDPDYIDNSVDFSGLGDLKQCLISVDGNPGVDYTHTSSSMAKGIFYSDMSEEEKAEAIKKLPLEFGWDEDRYPDSYDVNLWNTDKFYRMSGPVNKVEGPYPSLKYKVTTKDDYTTKEEALRHCKNPEPHRNKKYGRYTNTTYRCYESQIVSVCLENYHLLSNGKPDWDAIYCGEGSQENKKGDQVVYEISAPGYVPTSGALSKRSLEASEFTLTGVILNTDSLPVKGAKISFRGVDSFVLSDSTGSFTIKTGGDGEKPYSEHIVRVLKKIGFKIYNEELGEAVTDSFGIVSDGFTTLKLKVIANGVEPRTVIAKQPALGKFTGHTMLNLALALDEDGTGEMEYVPPAYLTSDQLTKHLTLKPDTSTQNGISPMLWVAEVPVTITYEDEEGNPGSYTFTIFVTRPPVMLIHGFTGNETTWANLANYMRVRKYEPVVREYYKGIIYESTIQQQSEKLGKYIQEVRDTYLKNHFLQNRIDIVAHSMGGLISRYYISNMAKYGKKAGIWIPYNIKLSRDELKAQRFKKPVVLNDVRKLIMVGTPNHGASWIDELLGFMGALYEGYHLIANAQLNSNSKFFEELNRGESEGRHLDKNVQYAVIYGIRKRSPLYPPDAWFHTWGTSQKDFASDDGVVTVSSAKLNGVKDFPFPKEWYAIHGYIHSASPIVQNPFPEDEPITESTNVFEQITELLQKDIPRVPLKNSSSKIIRARGDVSFKYLPTEAWKPINKIIQPDNAIKLTNNWCRLKTGEGSASLGFFLNGHQWGMLYIMPNTIAYYEYASPEFVKVYMQQGKARFKSKKKEGGGFEIVLGEQGEKWYTFNPKAKVKDLDTDFTVDANGNAPAVQSIYGMVAVGVKTKDNKQVNEQSIGKQKGITISADGKLSTFEVPKQGWWSSIDTTFLPDDTTALMRDSLMDAFDLGEIVLSASDDYLPVGSFANVHLHIENMPDTTVIAALEVENTSQTGFIKVANPRIQVDSTGNALFSITTDEPDKNAYASLTDIPLKVTLKVNIAIEGSEHVLAKKTLTLPIGMTLLTGKTTGPDFKPRAEADPPELFPVSFQIANQTDKKGNFFILFNTTIFNKELDKQQQYARRTGRKSDKANLTPEINWPETCSIPLKYELPDTIVNGIKAGTIVKLGNHGNFDILTPTEHEQRSVQYLKAFVNTLPLNEEHKSHLDTTLDNLTFGYNAKNIAKPTFSISPDMRFVIKIPENKKDFWGGNINDTVEPAYALVFHAMGHVLHQALVSQHNRFFNFLEGNCNGSNGTLAMHEDKPDILFDKDEYISFSEAGADLFAWLMFNFIKEKYPDFDSNSIYFHKGYISRLTHPDMFNPKDDEKDTQTGTRVQTAFLINFYDTLCQSKPVAVYADFLLNTMMYDKLTRGCGPATTIDRWLLSKHLGYMTQSFAGNREPYDLASKLGLFRNEKALHIVPRNDYEDAALTIDGRLISGFAQIPEVTVSSTSQITFGKGDFTILAPSRDTLMMFEADSASSVKVDENNSLTLLSGTFFGDSPMGFNTIRAVFSPTGNNFVLTISPKQTVVFNKTGNLKITTEKDEGTVPGGYAATISKRGKISKPKLPKREVPKRFAQKVSIPFVY